MPSCNFDHVGDDTEPFIKDGDYDRHARPKWLDSKRSLLTLLFVQGVIILSFSYHYYFSARQISSNLIEVYTPAYALSESKVNRLFVTGFGTELSEYQGAPNPVKDKAWKDLYSFGVSRVPYSDAQHLVNKTVEIPEDNGYFAVNLDVFHQLHCLNMIRKRIWATERPDPTHELMGIEHIDHCIDSLRQSLMCASDLTPYPFIWDEEAQLIKEVGKVLHVCRDFGAVRQWGLKNHAMAFNLSMKPKSTSWYS